MGESSIVATRLSPQNDMRYRSLDGLRGIASLIVVVHHCMLGWAPLASTYVPGTSGAAFGSALWWISQTPLKLLTAGGEAVIIFFILSGVVLTLPVLSSRNFDWWGYFPRRVVRLYLPAIAAVVLATIVYLVAQSQINTTASWWNNTSPVAGPTPTNFVESIDLLNGNAPLDGPLWSLKWEVLFSFLLPAIVVLVVFVGGRLWILVVLAAAAIWIGAEFQDGALIYLPIFVVGAAIAAALPRIRSATERFSRVRLAGLWWALFFTVSALALISYWLFRPLADAHHVIASGFSAVVMLGAAGIVVVSAVWAPFIKLLSTRIIQWLGRVSFSLYLVHQIALGIFTAMFGPRLWWLTAACTIVTALLFAEIFARFVEQPAHRLSKRVGAAFSRRAHEMLPVRHEATQRPQRETCPNPGPRVRETVDRAADGTKPLG